MKKPFAIAFYLFVCLMHTIGFGYATFTPHSDDFGSVIALTDSSGNVTYTASYGPHGEDWGSTGVNPTPFTWLGGYGVMSLDDGTPLKLYLTRHRLYSATLNRFLSADPLGIAGGLNLYEYCTGDPLTYIDPLGLCSQSYDSRQAVIESLSPETEQMQQLYAYYREMDILQTKLEMKGSVFEPSWWEVLQKSAQLNNFINEGMLLTMGGGVRVAGTAITSATGVEITGYTRHAINRAIGDSYKRAGTSPSAILDAIKNPAKVRSGVDELGRPFEKYIGKNAEVVVNPSTGEIITTIPKSGGTR